MRSLSLIPAYGRDYKSKKALLEDWNSGKDFQLQDYKLGNGYVSIRDLSTLIEQHHVTHLAFRYKKLTMQVIVPVSLTEAILHVS